MNAVTYRKEKSPEAVTGLFTVYDATLQWLGGKQSAKITVSVGFLPTWSRYNASSKRRISNIVTTLNSFIDIIHSTENKAIKEGTMSVNLNYKFSQVASYFMIICIMLIRRVSVCNLKSSVQMSFRIHFRFGICLFVAALWRFQGGHNSIHSL